MPCSRYKGGIQLKTWLDFGRQLYQKIKEHRVTGLAAEQAYYYLFSLFPLLILLLSILPYLSISSEMTLNYFNDFAPSETTKFIENTLITILSKRNDGFLTIGIAGTIWSASNGMNAFIVSMNIAFEVKETRKYIMTRLVSIFLTVGLIFSIIISLALPVFGNVILDVVNQFSPIPGNILNIIHILRWVIAIVVISIVLSFLYHAAPCIHLPYRQVFPGAITATILWLILSYGFSIYVSHFSHYSATYGSLGGVIILMLWLYLTGMAFIIGGEIIAILHRTVYVSNSNTEINRFLP